MFRVDIHEVHDKLVLATAGLALEGDLEFGLILALPQHNRVIRFRTLDDLGEIGNIDSKGQSLRTPIDGAGLCQNSKVHEGHVARIHGLELNAVLRAQQIHILDEILDRIQDTL